MLQSHFILFFTITLSQEACNDKGEKQGFNQHNYNLIIFLLIIFVYISQSVVTSCVSFIRDSNSREKKNHFMLENNFMSDFTFKFCLVYGIKS